MSRQLPRLAVLVLALAVAAPAAAQGTLGQEKQILPMIKASWVAFRNYDGRQWIYFTTLIAYHCGLAEIRYSIGSDALDRRFPVPACDRQRPNAIDPAKDVDGFHPDNLGRLVLGKPRFVPCTPAGCMRLLQEAGVDPAGKRALVIGRSTIVGKPMAHLLLAANATVTIAHSRTTNLAEEVSRADIVVAAVGRAHLVRGEWIKPGAAVIDVGMNRLDTGKLAGDVDFEGARQRAGAITPVPGGVGPMTIAGLMANVVRSAESRVG